MNIASIYESPLSESSFVNHDKSTTLIKDNKIYSYEEGKFSSIKNDGYALTPEKSLFMGFKELKLSPEDVDYWVFPKDINRSKQIKIIGNYLKHVIGLKNIDKNLVNKLYLYPHHDGHLSLAGFTSPFDKALLLSMDGGGDFGDHYNLVVSVFNRVEKLPLSKRIYVQHGATGLANFHGWLSETLGYLDDGKTSGLASYGKYSEEIQKNLSKLFYKDKNGFLVFKKKRINFHKYNFENIKVDSYQRKKFIYNQPGMTNLSKLLKNFYPEDIAFNGTFFIKKEITRILFFLKNNFSNISNICFAGGLFNNVNINNHIINSGIFKEHFFTMAPGDSGLSLGSALLVNHIKNNKKQNSLFYIKNFKQKIFSPYLGPSYSEKEIINLLNEQSIKFTRLSDNAIFKKLAKLLKKGFIIGLFNGKAEFGPRSLGHRSIVANPKLTNVKKIINLRLKKRDWFMPYAPSVLKEHVKIIVKNEYHCPYMQVAFNCNKNAKKIIYNGVHVDCTARVQSVDKNLSKKFYKLIKEFYKLTSIPAVLNTSFNRHGISTISTPRQALEHLFFKTCDILVFDNIIIEAKKNNISRIKKNYAKTNDNLKYTRKNFFKKINEIY